eukprot:1157323-Pelagomonas_calceolata.AAC.6
MSISTCHSILFARGLQLQENYDKSGLVPARKNCQMLCKTLTGLHSVQKHPPEQPQAYLH